jgi:hypothetical protein
MTTADLKVTGLFSSDKNGFVPASGGGTTTFLRADGTWSPPGGGATLADGDYGDVTVSGSGTVMTVDALPESRITNLTWQIWPTKQAARRHARRARRLSTRPPGLVEQTGAEHVREARSRRGCVDVRADARRRGRPLRADHRDSRGVDD